jgi:hypothetical protein
MFKCHYDLYDILCLLFKGEKEYNYSSLYTISSYIIITPYIFQPYMNFNQEIAVAQWLKYCATNQKVAGSIPEGVMEFFIDINPSDRTMALGATQPLTEMSTRSISWG